MRRLLLLCLAICLVLPASAAIPGDLDGDQTVRSDELSAAILTYLDGRYQGGDAGLTQQEICDAAYLCEYHDGRAWSVTDTSGRETVLTSPLRRVVVFNGETIETLRSIGFDTTRIVGVDKYTSEKTAFFPEFTDTANVGSVWSPDYEAVLALRPDAVFLYGTTSKSSCDGIQETLAASNPEIRVFRFDCYIPGTYMQEVREIAEITDREEEAEAFIGFYTSVMGEISNKTAGIPESERPDVYFEYWHDYQTVSNGSGYDEKITLAGGRNIFHDESGSSPEIDPEAVIISNPDLIIKLAGKSLEFGGYKGTEISEFKTVYDSLTARAGWDHLSAIKNGRVHLIHSDILGGAQHFIGTSYLAEWCYPEKFQDLDPHAIHLRYLHEFQHLEGLTPDEAAFTYP